MPTTGNRAIAQCRQAVARRRTVSCFICAARYAAASSLNRRSSDIGREGETIVSTTETGDKAKRTGSRLPKTGERSSSTGSRCHIAAYIKVYRRAEALSSRSIGRPIPEIPVTSPEGECRCGSGRCNGTPSLASRHRRSDDFSKRAMT